MNLRELQIGMTGDDVKILQEKLEILNFYSGTITGSFGKSTQQAVLDFQLKNNLDITGVVNQDTWNMILDQTKIQVKTKSSDEVLYYGKKGEEVYKLQKELKATLYYDGPLNGNFDANTANSVKQFQYNNKLTTDGVVGNTTWVTLDNLYSIDNCKGNDVEEDYYIVVKGDTLYSIATRFGLKVEELKKLNNLNSNIIYLGQKLIVKKDQIEEDYYIVARGDTLYSIANKFNTTVEELKSVNNLQSNILSIGQKLLIPNKVNENYYIVKIGDTLFSIANKFNTTVEELKRVNSLQSNILSIGQKLIIPNKKNEFHVVKAGDTLYSIANRYNTTINNLISNNNLKNDVLTIGQVLYI